MRDAFEAKCDSIACRVMQLSGQITYNGEKLNQFFPQRTAVYVNQVLALPTSSTILLLLTTDASA